ncbi:MAG: hypothetical protein MPW15_24560 [Candidatus Manganitrophus sp.]|nr:hypothetical protein [Candidatus Manganitrophus sp.]
MVNEKIRFKGCLTFLRYQCFVLGVTAVVIFLSGCATYTKLYDGPELTKSEIAIIHTEEKGFEYIFPIFLKPPERVLITIIDGKDLGGVLKVHLLPGTHRLQVRHNSQNAGAGVLVAVASEALHPRFEKELEFNAIANREYIIRFRVDTGGSLSPFGWKGVDYWIEDLETNEVVSGTKPAP